MHEGLEYSKFSDYTSDMDTAGPQYVWIIVILALWDLVWNGIALYKSARNGQKGWFVALLIVNSVGILPITYLLLERRKIKKAAVKSEPLPEHVQKGKKK